MMEHGEKKETFASAAVGEHFGDATELALLGAAAGEDAAVDRQANQMVGARRDLLHRLHLRQTKKGGGVGK